MSLHDAYARVTPWEIAFESSERAEALVHAVMSEAEARGADAEDPYAFVTMGSVAAFVAGLEGPGAPPGASHQFGALAFHGVHFKQAGCPLYVLSAHVSRYLVGGAPEGSPTPPASAGYLQLPQHLFWADTGSETPESVDGIFWTVTRHGLLHALLATGLRPDRPGYGVIPLPQAPIAEATEWLRADVRGSGEDFHNSMPGSDLDGLYAFAAAGEALKLLSRFFAYLIAVPGGVESHRLEDASAQEGADPSGGQEPERSRLAFTRVVFDG